MRFALDAVTRRYPGRATPALRAVTIAIDRGERVALMGASGSGKSTLLRLLAGLERPDEGRFTIDGVDATRREPPERGVGMVLQEAPLHEHLTLLDDTALPLRARGVSRSDARRRAAAMLERVRLGDLQAARGAELSGGERRRAALARALVTRPSLLLLDEPFASLDPALRLDLHEEVRRLAIDFDCAFVHATHDGAEALALGTRVCVLDRGEVVDDGPPLRVWAQPRSPRSAVLLGTVPMNILPIEGAPAWIGIRAEHLRISAVEAGRSNPGGPGVFSSHDTRGDRWQAIGTVEWIVSMGARMLITLRLDQGTIVRALVDANEQLPSVGARARAETDACHLHRFTQSPA